jgi:hypothetical protein
VKALESGDAFINNYYTEIIPESRNALIRFSGSLAKSVPELEYPT